MILDLAERQIFTKKNQSGQFKQELAGLKLQLKDEPSKSGEFKVRLTYKPLEKPADAPAAPQEPKVAEAYQPAPALAGKQQPHQEDEERPHPPAPEQSKLKMPADDDEVEEDVADDEEYVEPELPNTLK